MKACFELGPEVKNLIAEASVHRRILRTINNAVRPEDLLPWAGGLADAMPTPAGCGFHEVAGRFHRGTPAGLRGRQVFREHTPAQIDDDHDIPADGHAPIPAFAPARPGRGQRDCRPSDTERHPAPNSPTRGDRGEIPDGIRAPEPSRERGVPPGRPPFQERQQHGRRRQPAQTGTRPADGREEFAEIRPRGAEPGLPAAEFHRRHRR